MSKRELGDAAEAARRELVRSVKQQQNLGVFLEGLDDAAFVGKVDGILVAANSQFDRIYGGGQSTAGREPKHFLSSRMLEIYRQCDSLLKQGCDSVQCEHTLGYEIRKGGASADSADCAEPDGAPELLLCTVKLSLLGSGFPGWLCLGLSRPSGQLPPTRLKTIHQYWKCYEALGERDKALFQQLGRGKKQVDVARELELDPKTIRQLRGRLAEKFGLQEDIDFIRLLVRFQDAGFDDFGL